MGDGVIVSDSLELETSRVASVGGWWFETVIAGTEWEPVFFKGHGSLYENIK